MDVTHRTEQGISRRPNDASSVTDDGDSSYKWKVLASVVVGLFMVILDATVVNVALRSLQEKYAASTSDVQWIISLYTLALGIATPLSGFLGDRVGGYHPTKPWRTRDGDRNGSHAASYR